MSDPVTIAIVTSGIAAAATIAVAAIQVRYGRVVKNVKQQFLPNGGRSMRDAIDRIDSRSEMMERRMTRVEGHMEVAHHSMQEMDHKIAKLQSSIGTMNVTVEATNTAVKGTTSE